MIKKQVKLTWITDTSQGLFGLDDVGNAWVYQGNKCGWSKLNMNIMTEFEVKKKFRHRDDEAELDNDTGPHW